MLKNRKRNTYTRCIWIKYSWCRGKIKKEGLEVNVDYEEENSSTVAEGYVIKTTPQSGRSVTKYTKITLVVSSGESSFTIENYVGQLYSQVEGKLKAEGIKVEKTTKEVTDGSSENNTILEQDVLAGTKLKKEILLNLL